MERAVTCPSIVQWVACARGARVACIRGAACAHAPQVVRRGARGCSQAHRGADGERRDGGGHADRGYEEPDAVALALLDWDHDQRCDKGSLGDWVDSQGATLWARRAGHLRPLGRGMHLRLSVAATRVCQPAAASGCRLARAARRASSARGPRRCYCVECFDKRTASAHHIDGKIEPDRPGRGDVGGACGLCGVREPYHDALREQRNSRPRASGRKAFVLLPLPSTPRPHQLKKDDRQPRSTALSSRNWSPPKADTQALMPPEPAGDWGFRVAPAAADGVRELAGRRKLGSMCACTMHI